MQNIAGRHLPYNYDGSSCFMDSLFCALFQPEKLKVVDAYLLQGVRVNMSNPEYQDFCKVLQIVASAYRGFQTFDCVITYQNMRSVVSYFVKNFTGVNFARGQHDPVDLYEALMRIFNVGGVFSTKKTVQSEYMDGKVTKSTSIDQMFRYSVHHFLLEGGNRFEAIFPAIEKLQVEPTESKEADVLKQQRTCIEFAGGPVLCLTREVMSNLKSVSYGRWSDGTQSCVLPLLNTVKKSVQWYELQSVLCWRGQRSAAGELGHYVCYTFHEDEANKWWFYNDMLNIGNQTSSCSAVESPEGHPDYRSSETGVLFLYALISKLPDDI